MNEDQFREINRKLDFLVTVITGDKQPERGMIMRLHDLEEGAKRRSRWQKTSSAAFIAAAIGLLVEKFGSKIGLHQ